MTSSVLPTRKPAQRPLRRFWLKVRRQPLGLMALAVCCYWC